MPLLYLIAICFLIAINPGLIIIALLLGLLMMFGRRAAKVDQAGINAAFGGASMADAAVLRGGRL